MCVSCVCVCVCVCVWACVFILHNTQDILTGHTSFSVGIGVATLAWSTNTHITQYVRHFYSVIRMFTKTIGSTFIQCERALLTRSRTHACHHCVTHTFTALCKFELERRCLRCARHKLLLIYFYTHTFDVLITCILKTTMLNAHHIALVKHLQYHTNICVCTHTGWDRPSELDRNSFASLMIFTQSPRFTVHLCAYCDVCAAAAWCKRRNDTHTRTLARACVRVAVLPTTARAVHTNNRL